MPLPTSLDNRLLKSEGPAKSNCVIASPQGRGNPFFPGPAGAGRGFAPQGVRIATSLRSSQ